MKFLILLLVVSSFVATNLLAVNSPFPPWIKKISGDISIDDSGSVSMGSGSIASAEIVDGTILNADINASAAIDYSKLATLTDGNILVGNGSNVAASVNPSGDVDVSNAGAFTIQAGSVEAPMMDQRNGFLKYASAQISSADLTGAGTGVAHVEGPSIPDNSIIMGCWYEVATTFAGDGDDGSTIKIGVEDQDNDQVAAIAISNGANPWDAAAPVETISKFEDASTFVKLTAARQLAVTWTAAGTDTTLSAGSLDVSCLYIPGI